MGRCYFLIKEVKIMESFTTDYSKSSVQIILDLINAKNGTSVPLEAISFGTPAAITSDPAQAELTGITVTAVDGSGYEGSQSFTYGRVNLAFMNANVQNLAFTTDVANTNQLLPLLNSTFGINLTEDDAENVELSPAAAGTVTSVSLVAKAASLVFCGAASLNIVSTQPTPAPVGDVPSPTEAPAPVVVPLSTVFAQTDLGSLVPPPAPTPVVAAVETPTEAPTEAPSEVPAEAPTEAPTEAPVASSEEPAAGQ